jgi:hypothetical protein
LCFFFFGIWSIWIVPLSTSSEMPSIICIAHGRLEKRSFATDFANWGGIIFQKRATLLICKGACHLRVNQAFRNPFPYLIPVYSRFKRLSALSRKHFHLASTIRTCAWHSYCVLSFSICNLLFSGWGNKKAKPRNRIILLCDIAPWFLAKRE